LGLLASLVVLVSLTMASIIKLRWINLAGSAMYAAYGSLIHSVPVVLLNLGIVAINVYYLYKFYTAKERFHAVEADMQSELFQYFLNTYKSEIEAIISIKLLMQCDRAFYILRDENIAGMMVGDRVGDVLDLKLDFVFPKYRDFKVGEYYFVHNVHIFKERGIRKIFAHPKSDEFRDYLQKMGFRPVEGSDTTYEKIL
jgi:N-acetylglutamate synthase-like GNAT family acetyltransferase